MDQLNSWNMIFVEILSMFHNMERYLHGGVKEQNNHGNGS